MRRADRSRAAWERRRASPWRALLGFVIVLTLPCYCVGGLALGASALTGQIEIGSGWTPWLVVAALLLLLILLTEPWHGGVSTCTEVGIECAQAGLGLASDPIGCGTLLLLLAAAVALAFIFFGPTLFDLLPLG